MNICIKRYCKHSELTYMDMLWERHPAYVRPFMDEGKEKRAAAFADFILNSGDLL